MAEERILRDELKAALGETAVATHPGDHPSVDELLAYASGGLALAAAEEVEEHLTGCRACLDLVLDMEGFLRPAGEAEADEMQVARGWRELRGRLPAARRGGLPPLRQLALAASLLIAIGLLALVVSQHRRLEGLTSQLAAASAPRPDAPILDLFPRSAVRATAEQAPPRLPAGAGFVVLVLNLPEAEPGGRYTGELVDAGGGVLWRGELRLSAYGTFRLGLPGRLLSPPGVEIRLYAEGEDEQAGRLLETFPLEVGAEEKPP